MRQDIDTQVQHAALMMQWDALKPTGAPNPFGWTPAQEGNWPKPVAATYVPPPVDAKPIDLTKAVNKIACDADARRRTQQSRKIPAETRRPFHKAHTHSDPHSAIKNNHRRAKSMGAKGTFTEKQWKELCDRTGRKCLACGKAGVVLTIDHIVPLFYGGRNDIDNVQPLCGSCNSKKSTNYDNCRNDWDDPLFWTE